VLTRVRLAAFRSAPPPSRDAFQQLAILLIPAGDDTLRVHLTRSLAAERARADALLRAVDDAGAAVLIVDPAIDEDVVLRLRGMGYHDAFAPADGGGRILVRGAVVSDVATAARADFGHPLRSVTLRLR
jgi:hypothetical protein